LTDRRCRSASGCRVRPRELNVGRRRAPAPYWLGSNACGDDPPLSSVKTPVAPSATRAATTAATRMITNNCRPRIAFLQAWPLNSRPIVLFRRVPAAHDGVPNLAPPATSTASTAIWPASKSSVPAKMFISVDFSARLWPTRPMQLSAGIPRLTVASARTAPKLLATASRRTRRVSGWGVGCPAGEDGGCAKAAAAVF
jgi:hypothetical protein